MWLQVNSFHSKMLNNVLKFIVRCWTFLELMWGKVTSISFNLKLCNNEGLRIPLSCLYTPMPSFRWKLQFIIIFGFCKRNQICCLLCNLFLPVFSTGRWCTFSEQNWGSSKCHMNQQECAKPIFALSYILYELRVWFCDFLCCGHATSIWLIILELFHCLS